MKIIKLLRVNHWIKNILIFIPCFFNLNMLEPIIFFRTSVGAVGFSLMTSVIYIINDICDVKKDRAHPYKCNRPIASGAISLRMAVLIGVITFFTSVVFIFISCNYKLKLMVWIPFLLYIIVNILYSIFGFKNKPLIDIYILSLGFFLRVFFGATLNEIAISTWLYLVVIFGAIYLGFAKRRGELRDKNTNTKREVLKYYTDEFLNQNMYMALTISIIFYSLWCSSNPQYPGILWSIPMLLFIIFRYNYLVEQKSSSGDPIEVILKDKVTFLLSALYISYIFIIIYII